MRSSPPRSSNRQSSTRSAFSEKSEKFVPLPSQVGPSGNGVPGHTSIVSGLLHGRGPQSGPLPRTARRSSPHVQPATPNDVDPSVDVLEPDDVKTTAVQDADPLDQLGVGPSWYVYTPGDGGKTR